MKHNHFKILRDSIIVGYIDNHDVVHSQQYPFGEDAKSHYEIYGMTLKNWSWDFNNGLQFSILAKNLDKNDDILVKNHLKRKYHILFYENGHHDVSHFLKKMDEEIWNKPEY